MTTRADQDALIANLIPDNNSRQVSAQDVRTVLDSLENGAVWAVVGSGTPSVAAEREGDLYVDTSTTPPTVYVARDTNSASDYQILTTNSGVQTLVNKTLTTPVIGVIHDPNDNEVLGLPTVSSAVNYVQVNASATGNPVSFSAVGDDTNIGISLTSKGTGNVTVGPFVLDGDATVGASQDNYVLTYDHSTGTWGPEASSGGGGGGGYTQEEIEDFIGSVATAGTQSLITVTYNDAGSALNFTVNNDLSAFSNATSQFITAGTAPVTSVASKTGAVVLAASDISSGTFANARIAQGNVTQHQAALAITSSQVSGTFGTSSYADESVTLAKLSHMATASFIGRNTAGTGDPEILSATTARSILNVENGADVTDEANVTAALSGATLSDVGTPASTDQILLLDVSDSANLKYATYSQFAASTVSTSAGAPGTTPGSVGLINIDTTNDEIYISTDTASSADWDGPVLTENSGTTLTDTAATTADSLPFFDDSDSDNAKQDTIGDILKLKPEHIMLAVSDETTDLTTGTAKLTFRMPYAMTLTGVRANVNTAPVGSTIIVDINESGSTILSTKLSIDASEKTSTTAATAAVVSDSALADDAEITVDIDQVGSTTAGKGLKVTLIGTRT